MKVALQSYTGFTPPKLTDNIYQWFKENDPEEYQLDLFRTDVTFSDLANEVYEDEWWGYLIFTTDHIDSWPRDVVYWGLLAGLYHKYRRYGISYSEVEEIVGDCMSGKYETGSPTFEIESYLGI